MKLEITQEVQFDKLTPLAQLTLAAIIDHLTSVPVSVQTAYVHEIRCGFAETFGRELN